MFKANVNRFKEGREYKMMNGKDVFELPEHKN
jgi:hypothetical protein